MVNNQRAYIHGYLQTLEDFTVRFCDAINRDKIELSDPKVNAYHNDILQVLDFQRVKAARSLGLQELKMNLIFKKTDYDQITAT